MAMSKRDYQALARAVYRTRQAHPEITQHFDGKQHSAADYLVGEIMDVLKADNGRFNSDLFIEACETGACKGMRKVS